MGTTARAMSASTASTTTPMRTTRQSAMRDGFAVARARSRARAGGASMRVGRDGGRAGASSSGTSPRATASPRGDVTWRGSEEAPMGTTRRAAEAFVARWEAMGATPSASLEPELASLRPREGAEANLRVENAVYENETFRKMHCELAWGDGGFEVLHVVMYPWAERAAPVFAADVVGFGGRVSLCIADVAPVTDDLSLPKIYEDALTPELERALERGLVQRELPDWGRAILGPLCLCVGPKVGDDAQSEVDAFFEYAFTLHDAHCELASSTALRLPVEDDSALVAQTRFCDRQLENVKTRRALERAFGPELTDRYMRRVLFDVTASTPRSRARASSVAL